MKGKYEKNGDSKFEATAFCDRTGFKVLHKDLRRQYEWAGDQLVWTGLLVHKDFLDKPNEFFREIPPKTDPTPIKDPRPDPDGMLPSSHQRENLSMFNWSLVHKE